MRICASCAPSTLAKRLTTATDTSTVVAMTEPHRLDWLRPLYDAYHALGPDRDPQWSVSIEVADVLVEQLSRAEESLASSEGPLVVVDAGAGFSSCVIRRWAADLPPGRTRIVSTDLDAQYLARAERDAFAMCSEIHGMFVLHDDLGSVLDRSVHVTFWDLGRRADRMRRLVPFVERYQPDRIVLDDWHREPDAKWMGYELHERGYVVSRDRAHVDQHGRYAGLARHVGHPGVYARCRKCRAWESMFLSPANPTFTCEPCRSSG